MANSTCKVAAVLLVFLQVSSAISQLVNVPAVMTVNGFQQGEDGGGPAACDGQYHSDDGPIVSLSSEWYEGGARCGKPIWIQYSPNLHIIAIVVDECRGCDNEVGASAHIWHNFQLDPSVGEVTISWSDLI